MPTATPIDWASEEEDELEEEEEEKREFTPARWPSKLLVSLLLPSRGVFLLEVGVSSDDATTIELISIRPLDGGECRDEGMLLAEGLLTSSVDDLAVDWGKNTSTPD